MKPFEIFPAGKHRDSKGAEINVTPDMLSRIAANYSAAQSEAPIVIGHPKTEDPAYGWVENFSVENDVLVAHPKQVEAQFSQMVKDGRFKTRSISLYRPNDPHNPVPGEYFPRHVGFLGAAAPAIPNLKAVEFSAEAELETFTMDFSADFDAGEALDQVSDFMSAMQNFMYGLRSLFKMTGVIETPQSFAEGEAPTMLNISNTSKEVPMKTKQAPDGTASLPADFAQQQEALQTDRAALDKERAEFAAVQSAERRAADTAFVETLVTQGKVTPAMKGSMVDFMAQLPFEDAVEFSQADGTKAEQTPRDFFKSLLGHAKTQIDFSAVSEADKSGDEAVVDPAALGRAAQEFQADQSAKGLSVSMSEAVAHVSKRTHA